MKGFFWNDIHDFASHQVGISVANGIYESTCMSPLAVVLTKLGVSDIGYTIVAFATRMACSFSSGSPTGIMPSVTSVVLLFVP